MKNVKTDMKGSQLIITIDLSKDHGRSKSGKSTIVASTEGNISLPGGEKLGLNVYK